MADDALIHPSGEESEHTPNRREQRTITSRKRVLDAAIDCLIEEGYAAATALHIQRRADVSRGRLLHQFPSRDELLVAAVEHLSSERVAGTVARIPEIVKYAVDSEDRVARVVEFMWLTFHEPHYWAAMELWAAARTNDAIAQALLPCERRLGGVIRSGVDQMFGEDLAGHPRYPQLRELLLTSMRGVALTYAFERRDPRRDPHLGQWVDMARLHLDL